MIRVPQQAGRPEAHLVCPKGEIDADAIYCALFRAQAVLGLLHSKFFDELSEAKATNQETVYALDAVAGYLDQINILMSEA
jgi:hypothetical protein